MELKSFVDRWFGREGGAERANYAMFLSEFCQTLDLPMPDPSGKGLGDYEFEAPVKSEAVYGGKGTKRIDLYKRDCFILEAKQSQVKPGEAIPADVPEVALETLTNLFGDIIGHTASVTKQAPRYDRLMADARIQAERYALALPDNHKTPPFLIVADIGRSFELYFDWAGNGRGYSFFPDQQNYRITLDQLHDEKIRDLLSAIWTDPASVDPRLKAAEVTRDIAKQLSLVAGHLEETQRQLNPGKSDDLVSFGIESTSLFLMRLLFCMFAEDVGLLPKGSFTAFLDEAREKSEIWWRRGLSDLWHQMSAAELPERFWSFGDAEIRYFNGNLFSSSQVYDLDKPFKGTLFTAAKQDWRSVEPAIFGTLLEQVLTTAERAKLGAHYTPRPYVQRLVSATFGDLLNEEWEVAETEARKAADGGKAKNAVKIVAAFHEKLCALRILDPACGTGNFLYVSMEELLRIEGKALALAESLGAPITPAVHPNQFLGLELNPRAAVIAELVLWIGWLRHRLANHPTAIGDPVLPTLNNINGGTHGGFDAVLRRTATGEPDPENPMVPDWPVADFIVGNPPFIGGKDIRAKLGGDYAEALWKANPRVPKSADFVMQWWDHAAWLLTRPDTALRRFGFVTTNSITQTFSRRVIEGYLHKNPSPLEGEERDLARNEPSRSGEGAGAPATRQKSVGQKSNAAQTRRDPSPTLPSEQARKVSYPLPQGERGLSLILAIPDHPWTKATPDAAAVRIAMTVAAAGAHDGTLVEIVREEGLETDAPNLVTSEVGGVINADLTVGADVVGAHRLRANELISVRGIELHADGYVLENKVYEQWQPESPKFYTTYVKRYIASDDIKRGMAVRYVADFYDLSEKDVRQNAPKFYQHLLETAKKGRAKNPVKMRRELWWRLALPHTEIRNLLSSSKAYIGTIVTSKHRWFTMLDATLMPDQSIMVFGLEDFGSLGILSSNIHVEWSLHAGGTLEDRPRYNKSKIFDPFPFPDATTDQRATIAELAEELDATRKTALDEVPGLTMTEIYNLVAWLKKSSPSLSRGGGARAASDGGAASAAVALSSAAPPSSKANASAATSPSKLGEDLSDRATHDRATAARAGIVLRLHEQIDAAVADAYGWPADLSPSEIVTRLVALNAERAKEEAAGQIRWLRPDYQIPKFAPKK